MIRSHTLPALAGVLLVATAGAGPALAHAHLLSEVPAADARTASPAALTLVFSEGLELKFTTVVVTGPDGTTVATGSARLAATDAKRLIVPLAGPLAPGLYTVVWHAVATDTHKTQGSYRFTVAP